MTAIRTALLWTVPIGMTGMLAVTMGIFLWGLINETGVPGSVNTLVSAMATITIWAWGVAFVVSRTRRR